MQSVKKFLRTIAAAYRRWSSDGGSLLSAAVAYYISVAFFPMLLILLAGVGVILQWSDMGKSAEAQVLTTIEEQLSPSLRSQVETVFSSVSDKASLGGPLGIVTLLAAAIAIFSHFDAAFDRIWNIPAKSRGVWGSVRQVLIIRLKAFLMLVCLGGIVLGVFISGMVLSTIQVVAMQVFPLGDWVYWGIQILVTFLLNSAVFTLIYRFVPKVEVSWHAAANGGVLAAGIWEIGRQVLSALIIGHKYSSAYGVVGAFLAIMLWSYYAVSVVFFGAEYTQALAETTPEKTQGS